MEAINGWLIEQFQSLLKIVTQCASLEKLLFQSFPQGLIMYNSELMEGVSAETARDGNCNIFPLNFQ
jgi:hypothetical protein